MTEHTDIDLWQHDFNSTICRILTKANSIVRCIKNDDKDELAEIPDGLRKLHDEIKKMSNEMFTELRRLKRNTE